MQLLDELDAAMRAAAPRIHAKLGPPATPAELAALTEVAPKLPAQAQAWFAWHAGGAEGVWPSSSLGIPTLHEATEEARLLTKHPWLGPSVDEGSACPLLTDRGGGLEVIATMNGATVVLRYDRGDIVGAPVHFDAWIAGLTARWRREASVVRARFVRVTRNAVGWTELEIDRKVQKRVAALFEAAAPFVVCAHGPDESNRVDVDVGTAAFARSDGMIAHVTLPRDAMAKLAAAMKKGESFVLEDLDQVKWTFADR